MSDRLRDVDANLLLALHALLEEPNLSHAGARMNMSQSAMFGALSRLRKHFDDELLVRVGRRFELTPRAVELRPAVKEAVDAAAALLDRRHAFDPTTSDRQFTVSMSEYGMTVLAEPLISLFVTRAPGCSLALDTADMSGRDFEPELLRRDMTIAPLLFNFPGRHQPVFTDALVCIVAQDNPRVKDGALSLQDLREMPHAVAEYRDDPRERPLDADLRQIGVADRTVLLEAASLLTLPYAIRGTEMCAFVPARLAHRSLDVLDLQVVRTPVPPLTIVEAAHWHPRRDAEPALVWLRQLLYDVAVWVDDAGIERA